MQFTTSANRELGRKKWKRREKREVRVWKWLEELKVPCIMYIGSHSAILDVYCIFNTHVVGVTCGHMRVT